MRDSPSDKDEYIQALLTHIGELEDVITLLLVGHMFNIIDHDLIEAAAVLARPDSIPYV